MSHQEFSKLMGKNKLEEKKIDEKDDKQVREKQLEEIFYFYDIEEEVVGGQAQKQGEEEKKENPKETTQTKVPKDDFGLEFTD